MLKNRIIYLILLVIAVLFYILYSGVVSLYCLLFCVTVPLISLFVTLPLGKKPELIFRLPSRVNRGEKTSLYVRFGKKRFIPVSLMSMFFGTQNEMTGSETRLMRHNVYGCREYNGNFPIPTNECGMIRCDFPKIILYDYTGIFRRVIKVDKTLFLNVMPLPVSIEPNPVIPLGELTGIIYKPKRGGGFAEDYDIRNYRIGDPVNLIHWKMTAKRDTPMIREPLISEHGKACITIDMFGSADTVCLALSRLNWLLANLVGLRVNSFVIWCDPITHIEHINEINSKADIIALFDMLLSTRITENGETIEFKNRDGYTWQYHVNGRDGEAV